MKITPLGKIVLLLLAIGAGVGGYRFLSKGKTPIASTQNNGSTASNTSQTTTSNPNPANPSDGGASAGFDAPDTTAPNAQNEIELVSSASKKGWLVNEIEAFNGQGGAIKIRPRFLETREAMHAILSGKVKPALYSPSSSIWADRLSEAWRGSTPILDTGDSDSYKVLLRSPIVFLTTKDKAKTLRPLLASSACWSNIRALSDGKKSVPWGRFKWAHADPLNANSGMLTLAMIVTDFAEKTNQGGAVEKVAASSAFASYLKALESRLVYNTAVEKGSSALVKSFSDDPSRYDFICAYEASAIEAVKNDASLAVIYPDPTVNAENTVATLNGDWLSAEQKQTARDFLKFISRPESIREGMKEYFRPLRGASMDGQIAQLAGNGFKTSYSALELPPYAALNTAAVTWRREIAHKS